jgi:predicted Co/Zn/Cd cation transporter (cation efflux family)
MCFLVLILYIRAQYVAGVTVIMLTVDPFVYILLSLGFIELLINNVKSNIASVKNILENKL